ARRSGSAVVDHDLVQSLGIRSPAQCFAQLFLIQPFSQGLENLQVLFGRFVRYQKNENQIDRRSVQGGEIDLAAQLEQCADGFGALFQTAVGNGNTVAEAWWAEFFPGQQAFIYGIGSQWGVLGNQIADQLQHTLLGAPVDTGKGEFGGQDLFYQHVVSACVLIGR